MSRTVGSWRVALRIARREAARAKGRSALVLVMLALPVLGLTFAAVSWDMFTLTPDERADRTMGAADARLTWSYASPLRQGPTGEPVLTLPISGAGQHGPDLAEPAQVRAALAQLLPTDTRMIPIRRGEVTVRTADGLGQITAVALDASDPLARGFVTVLAGRAPRAGTEIALTHEAMARVGVGIGDAVTVSTDPQVYTVVGRVEFGSSLSQFALVSPAVEEGQFRVPPILGEAP